jgi:hypothetical protein
MPPLQGLKKEIFILLNIKLNIIKANKKLGKDLKFCKIQLLEHLPKLIWQNKGNYVKKSKKISFPVYKRY